MRTCAGENPKTGSIRLLTKVAGSSLTCGAFILKAQHQRPLIRCPLVLYRNCATERFVVTQIFQLVTLHNSLRNTTCLSFLRRITYGLLNKLDFSLLRNQTSSRLVRQRTLSLVHELGAILSRSLSAPMSPCLNIQNLAASCHFPR